ncbi:MAG: glycosyltransferase N-terminal domain-containing protein [Gemmatimonadota bacterium]
MNPLLYWGYRAAGELASLAAFVAPPGEGKLARTLRARRHVAERFAEWGGRERDRTRPLLWMHAPSVGEGLQARPILERMRARRPDVQLAYTFFSPSAESFARGLAVDFTDYLPFDTVTGAGAALDALRPTALVFAKLDVWPLLTREAHNRGVRVGLISGTVSPGSSRQRGIASRLLHDAYATLEAVGAVSVDDGARLEALGVDPARLVVCGDTRYDQVAARAAAVDRRARLLAPLESRAPTLVAGSTWPSDEACLLPAWTAVRRQVPDARLVIAPHEPTESHLAPIEAWGAAHGIRVTRLSAPEAGTAPVILVDRVGVLGDLYALASVAFVGGGFHSAGLHSVLEPAAFGAPVIVGPRVMNARDAELLIEAGGATSVRDVESATAQLLQWFRDEDARSRAGASARSLVERGIGAADRSFDLVASLLGAARPR